MSPRLVARVLPVLAVPVLLAAGCSLVGSFERGDCVSFDGGSVEEVDCDSAEADKRLGRYPDDCADGEDGIVLSRGGDERWFCPVDVE